MAEVKTEEFLTSEIEIEEHPIKLEPNEELHAAGMEVTDVKTELTSEIDIEEHPIKSEPEEQLNCVPAAGTKEDIKCDVCRISFTCAEILTWHTDNCHGLDAIAKVVKSSDSKVNYMCWLCNTLFLGLEQIVSHLLVKHQVKNWPFGCKLCEDTIMSKLQLEQHELVCKKRAVGGKWKYNKQQQAPKLVSNLEESHLSVTSYEIDGAVLRQNSVKQRNLQCGHCGFKYAHREMLEWHIEHSHLPGAKIKVLPSVDGVIKFQCVLCKAKISKSKGIVQHLNDKHNHDKLPYQCNRCKFRQFKNQSLLLKHQMTCKRNKLKQNNESLVFENHTVQSGDQISDGARQDYKGQHHCKHCGLNYTHRGMLDWHIKHCHGPGAKIQVLRIGQKFVRFRCVLCTAEYNKFHLTIQHLYDQHQLSRLPFQCNICKCSQFIYKSALLQHKVKCFRKESQVKLKDKQSTKGNPVHPAAQNKKANRLRGHHCDQCSLGYEDRELLQWHFKHCHGPDAKVKILRAVKRFNGFQCVYCKSVFSHLNSIIPHLVKEHNFSKLPYECDICKHKQFSSKFDLMEHKSLCNTKYSQCDLVFNGGLQTTLEISGDNTDKVKTKDDQLNTSEYQINDVARSCKISVQEDTIKSPYKCSICNRSRFIREKSLIQHQLMCSRKNMKRVDLMRQLTKEIPVPDVEDHSIKIVSADDQLDSPEHQINGPSQQKSLCNTSNSQVKCNDVHMNDDQQITAEISEDHTVKVKSKDVHMNDDQQITAEISEDHTVKVKSKDVHMNDDQQITVEISEDHTVKVKSKDDQLDVPESLINDPALKKCRVYLTRLLECELCRFYTASQTDLATHLQSH